MGPAARRALRRHVERCFAPREVHRLDVEPPAPGVHVFHVPPEEGRHDWAFFTIGLSDHPGGLEFVHLAPADRRQALDVVCAAAFYHANPDDPTYRLDIGHTVPIGEPWLGGTCEAILVSKPYPLGPRLEVFDARGRHVHFLWLLPITLAERRFAHEHGLEALEQRFDEAAIDCLDPHRASVV